MSIGSGATRRSPLPALPLRGVLHLDPARGELRAEMIGLRKVASRAGRGAFVEPALLLCVGRGLTVARYQREHAEHVIDIAEQMLQRALGLRADGSTVEHAIDVTQPREDDAH